MIPDEAVDEPGFSLADWFGREAPLVVEIGSGVGEATAALAAARPSYDVLALEVWRPGVADALGRVAEAGADQRAVLLGRRGVVDGAPASRPGGVAELWTFFPDPWHKKRHHKRRLVTPAFAALAAARLAPGRRVAAGHRLGRLRRADGRGARRRAAARRAASSTRWDERPVTKFERKGLAAGRPITDLAYRRT